MLSRRPIIRALETLDAVRRSDPAAAEAELRRLVGAIEAEPDLGYVADLYERAAGGLGDLLADHGRGQEADAVYRRMLARRPGCMPGHAGLIRLAFPGDNYLQVLMAVHAALRPGFYLEIGVRHGDSLRLAGPGTFALGVDPDPRLDQPLGPDQHVYAETSDAFFARWAERPGVASRRVDLSFLDGLHSFEQTLRDFMNVERRAGPGAIVLIHDCVPVDAVIAERVQRSGYWTGDVWKLLPILARWRPDLQVEVVGAAPSGLVVVRNLDPRSAVLDRAYDSIVAEEMARDFGFYAAEVGPRLRQRRSDAAAVAQALAAGIAIPGA